MKDKIMEKQHKQNCPISKITMVDLKDICTCEKEEKGCDKCKSVPYAEQTAHFVCDCECHQPGKEIDKILRETIFEPKPMKEPKDWEKEFEDRFGMDHPIRSFYSSDDFAMVKSFISNLLEKENICLHCDSKDLVCKRGVEEQIEFARQEERERLIGEVEKALPKYDSGRTKDCIRRNNLLLEIKQILANYKK